MVRTPNTSKWHSMIVWGCLSPFLAILIFLGSCARLQPLITLPNNWDLPKSSKNMKNTSKYVFLASKCPEQLPKSGRNTHNPCAKHFFEVRIGFRATLGQFKLYKLDFEIFMIFGHSDTISSIWKSLKITSESVKMAKNCNDGALARAYEIRKIQKVSEMKDMMSLSILCTHMSRTEVTCWFYSPKLLKKCQNCDFSCTPFWRGFLGVEISNRPNKVRVSKNRENHVFEYIVLEYVESSGEQPPTLRKMFRGHLGVENSILLNHDFGPKRNSEYNWKSTLQR